MATQTIQFRADTLQFSHIQTVQSRYSTVEPLRDVAAQFESGWPA